MNETLIPEIKRLIKTKGHANLDTDFSNLSGDQREYVITNMQSGGKYMLDVMPYTKNWVIKKNPNYVNHFWHDFKMAFIGSIFTLLAGIALWLLDNRQKQQDIQQLKDELKLVNNKLDSLQK